MEEAREFEAGLDMALDAGIRTYVLALREGGVETFESCEGGDGHPFPEPTVRFFGSMAAGFKAFGAALERGLPVAELRLVYPVNEYRMLTGPWWQMTFIRKAGAEPVCAKCGAGVVRWANLVDGFTSWSCKQCDASGRLVTRS